jgi:hypothetical protein
MMRKVLPFAIALAAFAALSATARRGHRAAILATQAFVASQVSMARL